MTRRIAVALLLPLLGACAAVPPAAAPRAAPPPERPAVTGIPPTRALPPPVAAFRSPQVQQVAGLEAVLERDAASLERMFGAPRLEVNEGDARKLQFGGPACVLDVFLYPLRAGAEPVVTYAEARRASDGAEVDRASCVQALRR